MWGLWLYPYKKLWEWPLIFLDVTILHINSCPSPMKQQQQNRVQLPPPQASLSLHLLTLVLVSKRHQCTPEVSPHLSLIYIKQGCHHCTPVAWLKDSWQDMARVATCHSIHNKCLTTVQQYTQSIHKLPGMERPNLNIDIFRTGCSTFRYSLLFF